jgi:ABC-type long-subunit fatty acid transport system fused permease/ATPase subunit
MDKLSRHLNDIKAIDKQRRYWLMLSIFVVTMVTYIVIDWNQISNNQWQLWPIGLMALITTIVWWYWTMRVIRTLLNHRQEEVEILQDLVLDIKDIKKNVRDYLTPDK